MFEILDWIKIIILKSFSFIDNNMKFINVLGL